MQLMSAGKLRHWPKTSTVERKQNGKQNLKKQEKERKIPRLPKSGRLAQVTRANFAEYGAVFAGKQARPVARFFVAIGVARERDRASGSIRVDYCKGVVKQRMVPGTLLPLEHFAVGFDLT